MKLLNFIKTHKMSILPMLLVVCAVMLGADCGFAMAIEGVDLAAEPNPSTNINPASDSNPEGRPDGEAPQEDEQGGKTQLQGKSATATDVRDAGI